jgi:hypothetical protein
MTGVQRTRRYRSCTDTVCAAAESVSGPNERAR